MRTVREKTGRCLWRLLRFRRIKQKVWARRADVSPSQISQYLAGDKCPELPTFLRLVRSLGFDLHDWQVVWDFDDLLFPSSQLPGAQSRPTLARIPLLDLLLQARSVTLAGLAQLTAFPRARIRDLLEDETAKPSAERDHLLEVLGISPTSLVAFRALLEPLKRLPDDNRVVLDRSLVEALLMSIAGSAEGRQLLASVLGKSGSS